MLYEARYSTSRRFCWHCRSLTGHVSLGVISFCMVLRFVLRHRPVLHDMCHGPLPMDVAKGFGFTAFEEELKAVGFCGLTV